MRLLAALAAALVACAVDPAVGPRDCTPGQTVACACPGASGVQTCGDDGRLGACVCADAASLADAVDVVTAPDRPVVVDVPAADVVDASAPDVPADAVTDTGRWVEPDVTCGRDETRCGGGSALSPPYCADLRSDPLNCGACGVRCPTRWENSAALCRPGGTCQFTCASGWTDCDGNIDNGCERRINEVDCRRCGGRCPAPLSCGADGRCVTPEI